MTKIKGTAENWENRTLDVDSQAAMAKLEAENKRLKEICKLDSQVQKNHKALIAELEDPWVNVKDDLPKNFPVLIKSTVKKIGNYLVADEYYSETEIVRPYWMCKGSPELASYWPLWMPIPE